MKSFALVAGARPNFVKIAPILRALEQDRAVKSLLIHTGQHYDENLSDIFFADLGIRGPDISLGVGSGSHAKQTAEVMVGMERVLVEAAQNGNPIDRLVVVGDVNSTMAAAVAAAKLNIPVAHVEAGLRSFDRTMPEEINRILTDVICDMLLVSEPAGVENLKREGHADEHIFLVGNVMIDTLLTQVERARARDTLERLSLEPHSYGVITLHRPSNVDRPEVLGPLVDVLVEVSSQLDLVFPIHPRTMARLEAFGLQATIGSAPRLRCIEPLGYLDFLCLTSQAKVIVTDSGGLQEESTALGVPCLTMRTNTERPITCTEGTSTLIGSSAGQLKAYLKQVLTGSYKSGTRPALWDGNASGRIARILGSC
jgi:UDP-N-acetylglucosamine 2-epimerase (non-hydrolysing)